VNDAINAFFEFFGGILVWYNVFKLYRDKEVKGVSVVTVLFFSVWGFWNVYYYPVLGQFLSTIGAIFIALGNAVWVVLASYYK